MLVKVRLGDITTQVDESQLNNYLSNGWELVVTKKTPLPTNYDRYTDKQLDEIAKVRGMNFEVSDVSKDDKIQALVVLDVKSEIMRTPTNEGFTDDLIIE